MTKEDYLQVRGDDMRLLWFAFCDTKKPVEFSDFALAFTQWAFNTGADIGSLVFTIRKYYDIKYNITLITTNG